MRQRAALLRTLLFDTDVILLDEPFARARRTNPAADAGMADAALERLQERTVVFVTHDVEEAIYLSDEIHVMGTRPGRVLESIPIALPRPRVRTTALTPDFIAIKERCMKLLAAHVPTLEAA